MGNPSKKGSARLGGTSLKGLTQEEILSLYGMGSIRTLSPGEYLIKEGDTDQSIHYIAEGTLRVLKAISAREIKIASFHGGDWLGDVSDNPRTESPFSVLVEDQTTVLTLSRAVIDLLSPGIKSCVQRALSKYVNEILFGLNSGFTSLGRQTTALVSLFKKSKDEATKDYDKIEIIRDLLQGFPRLPLFIDKLTTMLLNERVSTTEVVEYARTDPSVVSCVLKKINSPYYNLQEKVADFQRAVMLLGFNQIYQVALEECVFEALPKNFRSREFHTHSILVSLVGFELAALTNKQRPAAMSTVGLIHDIGQVLLLLIKNKNRDIPYLIDMLDDSRIAAMLFEKWNFPPSICETIRFQHYPAFVPPDMIPVEARENVALLYIAHLCCEYMGGHEEERSPAIFANDYKAFLGIESLSVSDLVTKHIYPPLTRRVTTLPQDIRDFLEPAMRQQGL
jgi:HD-like signal output (HDOD) protein